VARELGGEQHCRRGFADTPFGACEHNGWHITSLQWLAYNVFAEYKIR